MPASPVLVRWTLCCVAALLAASASGDIAAQQTAAVFYVPGARVCVLCDFGGTAGKPVWPKEIGLIAKSSDGLLYSTTPSGGANGSGSIFSIVPSTGAMRILFSFKALPGATNPLSGLVDGKDGAFYGTTYTGGLFKASQTTNAMKLGTGTIFKYTLGALEPETLHTFRNGDMTGMKLEICRENRPCVYSPQQRLNAAGGYPTSAPVRAGDGSFYGVTSYAYNHKFGVLYKLQPSGESAITGLCISGPVPTDPDITDAQLINQCMFNGPNGNNAASLTFNPVDGKLYGVTYGGGAGNLYGSVFQAELNGRVSTIHRFDYKSGSKPYSVLAGSDGNLYGTAIEGGTLSNGALGSGIIYKLTPAGQFTVLYTFTGGTDGSRPISGLIEAKNAAGTTWFYGSTQFGGEGRGGQYRITTGGQLEILHRHPNQ